MLRTASPGANRRVLRPALSERLEDASRRPITVIAAPAGSGKTALVQSWLETRGGLHTAAWVSVERGERDEQRLWSRVYAELHRAAPEGAGLALPEPSPRFDAEAVVQRLMTQLARLSEPLVLVIDDVHEIADPGILRRLAAFLAQLPAALHVVLISRHNLQLGLHRRRLEGELTEIRNDQLKFTLEETRQLMETHGVSLSPDGLVLLNGRAEGWIAGLKLAAVSLSAHPEPERFVQDFSGSERTVAEYLTEEVLAGQSDDRRRLLLRASLLDRVNGALGDLLSDGKGSERHLQELADSGAFVVALDPQRTWFRFHHLFADLLALELRRTEPLLLPQLHIRAAEWLATHDDPIAAITHAQAAGDDQLAASLLIEHYFTLALDGREASAHSLLEAYKLDFATNPPEIAAVLANDELARGSLDQAAVQLALAARGADQVPEVMRSRFDVALLLTRLTLARRRADFRSVLAEVGPRDSLADPHSSGDINVNNDVQTLMQLNLGIVEVWSGLTDNGTSHLVQARELAQKIARPYLEVSALAHQAQAETWQSFTRARTTAQEAIALAEHHGWGGDSVIAPALITMGSLFQAGRLDEAEAWLARADRTLRAELEPAEGFLLSTVRGGGQLARHRYRDAAESFSKAERLGLRLVSGSRLAIVQRAGMLYALFGLGDAAAAQAALADMTDAERESGEVREVLGTFAFAAGDVVGAIAAIAPTLDGSSQIHHPIVLVGSWLLRALTHDTLGEIDAGQDALERALDIAEPDALILPFMTLPSRELLKRQPRYRTAHGALIDEILDLLSEAPADQENRRTAAAVDLLSDAEVRVLRLLPSNLTVAAIASELYVTTNTVKTHMRHLYAKLDSHTREQAVDRGRQLGLLGASVRRSSTRVTRHE